MNLFSYVDLTNLNPEASSREIKQLIKEARKYQVKGVCVHPALVAKVARQLHSETIEVVTVVGFPLGMTTTVVKVWEAWEALKNGATEIDMVINHGWVADRKWSLVQAEIKAVKRVCEQKVLKVIIETSRYKPSVIKKLTKICLAAGADFIKTSTGFTGQGAQIKDVQLMAKLGGRRLQVKASGGVRTLKDFKAMLAAGATRIGTSNIQFLLDKNAINPSY